MNDETEEQDRLIAGYIAGEVDPSSPEWRALVADGELDMDYINSLRSLQERADEVRRWEEGVRSEAAALEDAPGVDRILETVVEASKVSGPRPLPPRGGGWGGLSAPALVAGVAALSMGILGWSLFSGGKGDAPSGFETEIQLSGTVRPKVPTGTVPKVTLVEWDVDLAPGDEVYLAIDLLGEGGAWVPFFEDGEVLVPGTSWSPNAEQSADLVGDIRFSVRLVPAGSPGLPATTWTARVTP